MKILITGCTALQVGHKSQLELCSLPAMLAEGLRDAGHVVEHRETVPLEPLGGVFDRVIVGIAPPPGLGGTYLYGAFDVIARARREGVPMAFMLDDWRMKDLDSGFRNTNKVPSRLTKPLMSYRRWYDWAVGSRDYLEWVLHALATRPWPATIVPIWDGGDLELLRGGLKTTQIPNLVPVDPSAYVPRHPQPFPSHELRERKWVLGSLSDNDEWLERQGLGWPVESYGRKSRGQEKLQEPALVKRYADCWGVVSLPYPHAGSGWWRSRFVYATRARALLLADPAEVAMFGPCLREPVNRIESRAEARDLFALAVGQAREVESVMWPRDRFIQTVDEVMRELV